MMSNTALSQQLRILPGLGPQDITTPRTGTYQNVAGCQRILAAGTTGAIANTKTATIGFMQAKDAAGTGAKALGSTIVATSSADGSLLAPLIEAQITDLDTNNGYGFVAPTLVSNNASAVQATAILVLGVNRHNP